MTLAVYPGSFDPPTLGHLDIVLRARKMFSQVTVLVARNSRKNCLFTAQERVQLFRDTLDSVGATDVDVATWDGLTVSYCKQIGAGVMVRGLRHGGDFEAEFSIALMNKRLDANIETVYIATREEYLGLTSTLVREIARLGSDVSAFVAEPVAQALRAKLNE